MYIKNEHWFSLPLLRSGILGPDRLYNPNMTPLDPGIVNPDPGLLKPLRFWGV
jgi:hypothetical protein